MLLAAWIATVAILTLRPIDQVSSSAPCVICGQFGGVDFFRNVVMFLPVGHGRGLAASRGAGQVSRVTAVLSAFSTLRDLLQTALLWIALAVAGIAVVDWMVRTRRLSPFGPVARFFRQRVDPWLEPVERRVVRLGGLPASAPWWALAAVVGGGILLLAAVDFAASLAAGLSRGLSAGPSGLLRLAVFWAFTILRLAIIVSVVVTWLPVSRFSPWVRWAFVLAEPILRPLRRIVPTFGGIDITPIIGFFGLSLLESLVRGALA